MSDPVLYARNETRAKTVTFNSTTIKWELPPFPDPNYISLLPWEVATSNGFDRVWDSGDITVALDRAFTYVVTEIPDPATLGGYRPFVFHQADPQASTLIQHDFNRSGPVGVVVTSPDGEIQYEFVSVDVVDPNTCRINLDDPAPFLATIF